MNDLNLADLRRAGGLSQALVAKAMNVTKSSISGLEARPLANVTLKTLVRYIAAIGGELTVTVVLADRTTVVTLCSKECLNEE
jgi:transcriptional regulator with XRE-family HTH domain